MTHVHRDLRVYLNKGDFKAVACLPNLTFTLKLNQPTSPIWSICGCCNI